MLVKGATIHYQTIIIANAANTIYDAQEHASMKLKSEDDIFVSWKCIWKCHGLKDSHIAQASIFRNFSHYDAVKYNNNACSNAV